MRVQYVHGCLPPERLVLQCLVRGCAVDHTCAIFQRLSETAQLQQHHKCPFNIMTINHYWGQSMHALMPRGEVHLQTSCIWRLPNSTLVGLARFKQESIKGGPGAENLHCHPLARTTITAFTNLFDEQRGMHFWRAALTHENPKACIQPGHSETGDKML